MSVTEVSLTSRPSVSSTTSSDDSTVEPQDDRGRSTSANEDLQHTLTDLLNTNQVRQDPALRLLIQTRLMDAERERRKSRRSRRGSPTTLSPASSIEEHNQEEA